MFYENALIIIVGIICFVSLRFLKGTARIITYVRIGVFLLGLKLVIIGSILLYTEITSGL